MTEQKRFRFLTQAEFELLAQREKLAYLSDAMDALHRKTGGWSSLFSEPDSGTKPPDPASNPQHRQD